MDYWHWGKVSSITIVFISSYLVCLPQFSYLNFKYWASWLLPFVFILWGYLDRVPNEFAQVNSDFFRSFLWDWIFLYILSFSIWFVWELAFMIFVIFLLGYLICMIELAKSGGPYPGLPMFNFLVFFFLLIFVFSSFYTWILEIEHVIFFNLFSMKLSYS